MFQCISISYDAHIIIRYLLNEYTHIRYKLLNKNAEKSKIMAFSKGKSRKKDNNKDDSHIQDLRKRATAAMVQIWSIGESKFGGDFRSTMIMFNTMVKTICMYVVEIWGIEERKEIDSIQYLKNILGLERCAPGYLVRNETKTERILMEAGERVIKYKGKIKR